MEEFAHIVIEASEEADCHFIASWMMKAAEAQTLFLQAASEPSFREDMDPLWDYAKPDLACLALFIVAQLQQRLRVITLDVDGAEGIEVAMLVHLGFLVRRDVSYRLTTPKCVWLEKVKQAASRVISTAEDFGFGPLIQPELLLKAVSVAEAEAWRSWILQMRYFDSELFAPDVQTLGCVRLMNIGRTSFRIGMPELGDKLSARNDWILFAEEEATDAREQTT